MSLSEQLAKARENAKARIPEDVRAKMESAIAAHKASGVNDGSLKPGARVPDFALPDADGNTVTLGALLKQGPVVVSFYRGGWCPYCNLELRALQEKLPQIHDLGASLVAVSPERPDASAGTVEKTAVEYAVLSDDGNRVAERFGLVFILPEEIRGIYQGFGIDLPQRNGDETFRLPVPGTFVIDRDGTVVSAFVDPDYRERLDPEEIVSALQALSERSSTG